MKIHNTIANLTADNSTDNIIEVLGYQNRFDGGGGVFHWISISDLSGILPDNGMFFQSQVAPNGVHHVAKTGMWVRKEYIHKTGFINVKWFGAVGDGGDCTNELQAALNFVARPILGSIYNLYIPQGIYRVNKQLLLDLSNTVGRIIQGDGTDATSILYTGAKSIDVFKIIGRYNNVIHISNIHIAKENSLNTSTGLKLQRLNLMTVNNLAINGFDKGIELLDVNGSEFNNIVIVHNNTGIYGLRTNSANDSPPNLINFTSCNISSNNILGAQLSELHSVNFFSCNFASNGHVQSGHGKGAIDCMFTGINGANGLNISGSYFEGNNGEADVKISHKGVGTHTFTGNTFNRLDAKIHTKNNILIIGTQQTPQPKFGAGKCKLVFQGNGFFVANDYVPDPDRAAIYLNSANEYWQFDIVEQGNVYKGIIDAPEFNSKIPQVSEQSRIKVFGKIKTDGSFNQSYNIDSVTRLSAGKFRVLFANELQSEPVVSATPILNTVQPAPIIVYSTKHNTSSVEIHVFSLVNNINIDAAFDLIIF